MKSSMTKQLLIFTDLDGTLLDDTDYRFDEASSCLSELKQRGIPVIPVTSKTLVEVLALRKRLDLSTPFIVENGGAIYLPCDSMPLYANRQPPMTHPVTIDQTAYWCYAPGRRIAFWQELLARQDSKFAALYTTFSSLDIEQISALTGLNERDAKQASEREFSDPIVWQGNSEQRKEFIQCLSAQGITVVDGGRFLHLMDTKADKGRALLWLEEWINSQLNNSECVALALGDSENDISMLNAANTALLVRSKKHPFPNVAPSKYQVKSRLFGPAGWSELVTQQLIAHFTKSQC